MWAPQIELLRSHRRVLAYDHRGHGGSPAPSGPYAPADLVDDVVALLDRLEIAAVDVVGISLGGTVGLALAAAFPERVRSVVTVNAPAFADDQAFWTARAAAVRARGMAVATTGLLGRWYAPATAASPGPLVTATVDAVGGLDPEGYAACCEAIAAVDLRPALPGLDRPVLVVTGTSDAVVPAHHAAVIAGEVPGARRVDVEGAGHLLSQEVPEQLHHLLTQFWAPLGAPTSLSPAHRGAP
jgi:3-oxoadipate enol-lactonase